MGDLPICAVLDRSRSPKAPIIRSKLLRNEIFGRSRLVRVRGLPARNRLFQTRIDNTLDAAFPSGKISPIAAPARQHGNTRNKEGRNPAMPPIVLILAVLGLASPDGEEPRSFQLTCKKLKEPYEDLLNEQHPVALIELPKLEVRKEPALRSKQAKRFAHRFGLGEGFPVSFIVDESKGTGKGYDCLYVDSTGSGTFANCIKVKGKAEYFSDKYQRVLFGPLDIHAIPGAEPLSVQVRLTHFTEGDTFLFPASLSVVEGTLQFGGIKQKIRVFDADCDGVFGEPGRLDGAWARGDYICVGGSLEGHEARPVPMAFSAEGCFFEVDRSEERRVGKECRSRWSPYH